MSKKCCVSDCGITNNTGRLFCMPSNPQLRQLWMSFLVPHNPRLLNMSESYLLKQRVCSKHFDKTQFDSNGSRLGNSYPCLFTPEEMLLGEPLATNEFKIQGEHNYFLEENGDNISPNDLIILRANQGNTVGEEHNYQKPTITPHDNQTSVESMNQMVLEVDCSETNTTSLTLENQQPLPLPLQKIEQPVPPFENMEPSTLTIDQPTCSINDFSNNRAFQKKGYPRPKKSAYEMAKKFKKISSKQIGKNNKEIIGSAKKCVESNELFKNFDKLNHRAKTYILMQLKLDKDKKSRRYSLQDKLLALSILKQSPKGYRLLESMFSLPSKRTLLRLAEKIVFDCGINENIFKFIKEYTKGWETPKKLCTLVFDEVALTPHLVFNEKQNKINGFVEIAGDRRRKIADHALVFMVRGVCTSWRQTIGYYICEGTVSAPELEQILKIMIPQIHDAGLIPIGLVCDQGSTFRSCLKNIKASTSRQGLHQYDGKINISGHDLLIFFDPPHLLKGVRNNFLTKDVNYDGKRASWKDIQYIYDVDNKSGHTRALPKINAQNVYPKKINKMKVKSAAQVLSARTAAMLNYTYALYKRLDENLETMPTTAAFVEFMDDLFDSVNGSPGSAAAGKMRSAVKPTSKHEQFWREAIIKFKAMQFIDTNSKLAQQAGKERLVRVPSLDGWITTLESFIELSKLLFNKYGIKYYYPRFINQDPLENFFGRIRAINYRNNNPDVNTFIYTFKSLLLSNILSPHSKYANCEEDDGENIINLNFLFQEETNKTTNNLTLTPSNYNTSTVNVGTSVKNTISEKARVQISAYTAGYMCRKMSKKLGCNLCKHTYVTEKLEGIHEYIKCREYKQLKNSNLVYPKGSFLRLYRECAQLVHDYLNEWAHTNNIKTELVNIIYATIDMEWLGCKDHAKDLKYYFVSLLIRLHSHSWCKTMNNILAGKIEQKYVHNNIQNLAYKKYLTYKLRKKTIKK